MGRDENINMNRTLGEADSSPCGWLWVVQDFTGGTADVVAITRELDLKVGFKDVTKLLQPWDKTWMLRSSFFWVSKESGFLRWHLPVKRPWRLLRWQQRIQIWHNLVDQAVAGGKRMDSSFGRSSTIGKMLSDSITSYREIVKRTTDCGKLHCCLF